ncbi:MAG: hypothetical protein K2Q22_01035, partial [Cytophagales bacterium]|nr:hypothetical protein [Cytophagales bacterium]
TPRNISNNINTENHDACIGMSPDGRKLLVYKSHKETKGDIYVSEFKNELWTKPEKLADQINSDHFEPSASLTADEATIYFSSDKPGGYGGLDLYMCQLQPNGKWGKAINLGPKVNTPFDEDAPFIYSDNKTLYFSSNGHATMGGYDILKSTFNKSDSTWSEPQNLRYPINTPDDDIYFNWNYDGTRAYFSSHREDSEGGKDLYYLERTEINKPIAILKGKILEKGKDTHPPAIIKMTILKNNNENEVIGIFTSNGKRGNFVFSLPGNAKYNLTVEAPGYVYYNEIIEIPQTDDFQEIVRNIVLEPIKQAVEEKKPIVLNNIYFEYNKALLKEESVIALENVKQMLTSNMNVLLEI